MESSSYKEFHIPFFAHRQHGGARAKLLSQSSKKARLELLDGKHANKKVYVNVEHVQHLIDSRLETIELDSWVDQFQLKKELGKGTYGSVAAVINKNRNESYALKTIIHPDSDGFVPSLIEECIIFSSLSHPNLVRPLQIWTDYDRKEKKLTLYFLMEEMTMSLRGLMNKLNNRPLPRQLCEFIIVGILQGIHHMNQQGYSHSDLSPNNVLLKIKKQDNGQEVIERVCLTDYSLSRSLNGRTLPTRIVTCWYRAPELFANYKSYTLDINMWSIGIITLECICGHPIFWKADQTHTVERMLDLCGIPSQKWYQRYGQLPAIQKPVYGNNSTSKLQRIEHVLQPRPHEYCHNDVEIKLTKDMATLVKFVLAALDLDPTKRISTRRALQDCFGQPIERGYEKKQRIFESSEIHSEHFKQMCECLMEPFRHRTCALHADIVNLSVLFFNAAHVDIPYSQWSLLMVACCSLACKYIIYDKMSMYVSPVLDNVLRKIGLTGKEYSLTDVYVAECFVVNRGALLQIKS